MKVQIVKTKARKLYANPVAIIIHESPDGVETVIGAQYRWNTGEIQNRIDVTTPNANGMMTYRPIKIWEIGAEIGRSKSPNSSNAALAI